jgi:long-chain acyl-CoA synthetase
MANFCVRIAESATRFPDLPAIELAHADGRTTAVSYAGLMRDAGRFGGWLKGSAGLSTGDRAAILADNDARWIAAYLGTMWIGAVAVPLDTAYKPAQVRAIVQNSGARVLFTTPKYLETALAAAGLLGAEAPRIVLLAGSAANVAGPAEVDAVATAPPMTERASADSAVILYTSGTTADPKGVVLTHGNLDAERLSALSIVHCTEHDAVLGVLPLFHALAQMANLLLPLSVGARVVFLETVNSTTLLGALETRGITIFACVPQFFYLIHQRVTTEVAKGGLFSRRAFRTLINTNVWLRDHLGWNPGRLVFAKVHRALGPKMRVLVTGGSRFDPTIGRDLYGMGLTLLNGYGLTETSGAATIQRPDDKFTSSVGQALPGVEVRIGFDLGGRNPSASPVDPRGRHGSAEEGEILIRGAVVMREYFNRPDATAEALREGWLHTGDLGRLDEKGRVHITGRLKEIIVLASGKNLYPEEIEAHYKQCVFIKELCVLGLARPGEPAAERLHAVIVPNDETLRERGTVNVRDLLRFELETLSVQLPAHKRILSYDISLEPLPRTTTGKLKRPEIERRATERAASAARTDDRPLAESEREWLAQPGHAAALQAVVARLDRSVRRRPALRPDANLELDLGLDSMERVELLTHLELRAGTQVSPAVRATIFTVRQLVDAVEAAPRADASAITRGADANGPADDAWDALLALPADPELEANLRRPKPLRAAAFFIGLRLSRIGARLLLRFKATGLEHVPTQGPFLLCPNHQTSIDPLFLVAVLPYRTIRQFYAVGAAEYFQTPFSAWLARAINVVPVDPDANLINAMQAGATGLRMGKVLVLFPEGERSIDGEIKPFRRGAAILSAQMQAPIVPIALDGLYELWPRGWRFQWKQLLPWRSRPVTIRIGPPMRVTRGAYHAGTTALQQTVAGLLAEIRTERPPMPSR